MSSSSTTSKLEKEKLKLIQEKCQGLLNEMLRDDDNKYCVDCDAKGPRWASWNLGIFLCIRCAGIHRNLGVHISRVKSVNLDTWTPEQVVTMQQMGNSRARAVYEATMPDSFRRPQTDVTLENFIRAKYEHKKYLAQEWVKPSIPKVNWDSEIEDSLRKKKEAKKLGSSDIGTLPTAIPKPKSIVASGTVTAKKLPASVTVPPPAQPTATSAASSTLADTVTEVNGKSKNPSDDLLGLMTHDDSSSNLGTLITDPFASPIKSNNNSTPNANSNSAAHDLGSIFLSSDPSSDNNGQKMTKESILSLYGQGSGNSVNPFTSPNVYPNQGAPSLGNPFPQQYASSPYNPNLMGHQQGSMNPYANHANSNIHPSGATDPTTAAGLNNLFNFQTDVSQIQQQMYGVQLSFNNQPNRASLNMGNNLIGNYPGQTSTSGIHSFLPPTANSASFPSPVGQTKNPGPGPFF